MPYSTIQNSFVAGEISPNLLGRVDLAKWHQGASTMRNFFVNVQGGASTRAGTCYIAICKQPGDGYSPRDIPFQFNVNQGYALEFGDQYMRVKTSGAYVLEANKDITGATNANPLVLEIDAHGYSAGDWIFISSMEGMTELDGLTWIVATVPDANHVTLTDLFGQTVDSTNYGIYTSGGTAARVYTVNAPYAAEDLPYLKFTQSADTMTLTCVNTQTDTEYPPYELQRFGLTDWRFTQDSYAAKIDPPTNVSATAQSSTTTDTWYSYVVTAVDQTTGEESVASSAASVKNNDIAVNAGSNTITWDAVKNAGSYNIYKATPSYNAQVPVGVLYGFAGSSLGTSFTDTNITADFTIVPPVHNDPFARGTILSVTPTAVGSGYTQATVGFSINSSTGSGFQGTPVVVGGSVTGFIIENGGSGYVTGDTMTITDSGTGTGATVSIVIGPSTGTYPSTVAYYQQRRAYASSLNNPDTYWLSQPGSFQNMDASVPTTDSDSITGSPWAQQVNGIQWMLPMPGGLVMFTGQDAWQVNGGNNAAITPADQTATPEASSGCAPLLPPLRVYYDILYAQAKGTRIRDLAYNFFVNIYTGTDLTVLSSHLFDGHSVLQWGWAEEPYKIVWAVRDDGILLSLTYLKEQDVYAWGRHDTQGLFEGVCVTTEAVSKCGYVQGVPPEPPPSQLWVASQSCAVLRFNLTDSGNISPQIDIQGSNTGLTGPLGDNNSQTCALDFDADGNKFVIETVLTNAGTNAATTSIYVFPPIANGNIAPSYSIAGNLTGLETTYIGEVTAGLYGICLDTANNIYVGQNLDILKFPAGSTGNVASTTLTSFNRVINCLEFDSSRNWIWATLDESSLVANIYAVDLSGTTQRTITLSGYTPYQITVDSTGKLYVCVQKFGESGVMVFAADANGSPSFLQYIRGVGTTIKTAYGVAVDSDGLIYVSGVNQSSVNQVAVFAANADGNVAPLRTISGSNTGFDTLQSGDTTLPNGLWVH